MPSDKWTVIQSGENQPVGYMLRPSEEIWYKVFYRQGNYRVIKSPMGIFMGNRDTLDEACERAELIAREEAEAIIYNSVRRLLDAERALEFLS